MVPRGGSRLLRGRRGARPPAEPHRPGPGGHHQERCAQHGQRGDGQKHLVVTGAEQPQGEAGRREDERELADLGHAQPGRERGVEPPAAHHHRPRRHRRLHRHQQHRAPREQRQLPHHHRQVEQHADRGEEHPAEQGAKRHDVVERLQAVLGLGDDQTGQERADREREPRGRRRQGGPDREEPDAQREQIPVAGLDDPVQRPADHQPPAGDERDHRREPQSEPEPEAADPAGSGVGAGRALPAGAEQRDEEHERHDGQVLEQQDGDGLPAVRRVQLAAVGEGPADDSGGRQRGEGAVEQALPHRKAEHRTGHPREHQDARHLQAAGRQNRRPPAQHLRQRELQPDLEQQQHHPRSRPARPPRPARG